MNNDGGGDALRKAANLGSVDLDLSEVDDVSAIYDYFNSVLKEKPKSLDIGSVSFDETTPDSSTATALHGKGSVSDCFYHIHKHGSQLGVRLLLPALNRVLCSDRVSQMTKTYNDVEAVTRLLEEKEKDIELTARIGKELLAHNQKLESTVAALEVEIKAANEKITQLTYDLHRKTELINVLTNDDSCSEASTPTGGVSLEFMQRRIGLLENENKILRDETSQLASQTDEIEAQEAKLYAELSEQLTAARVDVSCLTEEADRCREEARTAQNLASTLQEKLTVLEQKYNDLTMSNEDLSNILGFAKQTQEELTTELAELKERYAEVLGFLHDTQEALKQLQKKNQPTAKGGLLYASLQPQTYQSDSLAMELESSLFSELSLDSGISTERGLPHYKKVFDTVRCASRGSTISSGRSSDCSPYPDPLMKPSLYKPMSSDLLMTSSSQPRMSSHFSNSGSRSHRLSSITLDSAGLTDSDSSIDDFYNYPSSAAGVPGIPGSEDLAAALNKLTPGEVAARRRQLSSGVFSSHVFEPSETPRTPDSIMSTGSSGAFPFGFGMSMSTPWRLPEKLQIVKPMEGSQTLQQWSQLATPSMGGLLDEKPGIKIRGGKDLEALGLHVFTLDDVEEDDEVIHPGKSFQNSGTIYTYTNSTVMHPDDNTSVSASIAGSRMSTAANSRASSVAPTPLSRSRRNSCSTFSTGLGLAKLLNERGIQAATPSTFVTPRFSPTATPCNSPTRSRSPSPTFSPFTLPSYLMSSGAKLLRRTLTGSSSHRSRSTSRHRDSTPDKKPLGEIKLVETIERIGVNTLMSTTASDTNISDICSQLSKPSTIDATSSCLGIPGKPGSGILESRLKSLPNNARRRPTSGKQRQDLGVVLGSVSSLQKNDAANPPTTAAQSTSSPALGTLNKVLFGRKGGLL
ncbi:trafficking kinesin-binding protein milt isoform X2 [Bemisia tabaci]|uniref:trafficking kinesin-binding protein milt isoform X2 n=1 Tax=Bemisia tabaci TaxID=7038 RepID=UPI0008F9CBF6|nr:PREDICTED: trafficking kinesin-binding protein milt isoform X2 [Bemisia tabaci]XP_018910243.1 PREDICTED: trafficking kinesin-binding protein milt isoform X2 [Bemisia tabaci]XP_018910245.1 PREDICTED: trafficking kinesin-binding protein milt isoform X2 [Bemisia tabaci]XP_018910246.1 PREDICTED: trafficking kinesin-binding protein milt isoform X2 [Bemisia tabaci]